MTSRISCVRCGYPAYNESYHDCCPDGEAHEYIQVTEGKSLFAVRAATVPRGQGKYLTATTSCQCPDHLYRKRACKHMKRLREGHHPDGTDTTTTDGTDQRDMESGQQEETSDATSK